MKIRNTIKTALNELHQISEERKKELKKLSVFVKEKNKIADLIFICTHNSRRSHLCQVWAIPKKI